MVTVDKVWVYPKQKLFHLYAHHCNSTQSTNSLRKCQHGAQIQPVLEHNKPKEIIIDCRRIKVDPHPLFIGGSCMDFRILGTPDLGSSFCDGNQEGCLSSERCCNGSDPGVVAAAEKVTCCPLPSVEDLHRCPGLRKAHIILRDPSHPELWLFEPLFHANKSGNKQVKTWQSTFSSQSTRGFLHDLTHCESGMFDEWYVQPFQ